MAKRPPAPLSPGGDPKRAAGGKRAPAFDLFLDRSLHALYDDVVNEAVPDKLLRLIEDDRPE